MGYRRRPPGLPAPGQEPARRTESLDTGRRDGRVWYASYGSNLLAALFQFPLAIYLGVDESWSWLASDAGLALTGIAFGSCIAYAMFFCAIKTAGPVFASQCAYAVTISGVIWGIIIFSERHSIWIWISVVVLLLGLVLVSPDEESEDKNDIDTAATDTSA